MGSKIRRLAANHLSGAARTFSEQVTQTLAARDLIQKREQDIAPAKAQLRLRDQPFLGTFHGKGDGGAGGNRVQTQLIATPRGFQDDVGIADAAERAEREQALVLEAHLAAGRLVNMLAADGARRA